MPIAEEKPHLPLGTEAPRGTPERRKKRQLELDEDELRGEERDTVVFDDVTRVPIRRGKKEARRISGAYREIRSLEKIGKDAEVMQLVFGYMNIHEVLQVGHICSMWNVIACRLLRRHLRDAAFVRSWNTNKSPRYLWLNWELHFHDELVNGTEEEDDEMTEKKCNQWRTPGIQSLITIGDQLAWNQLTDEEAKLPFIQDHLYLISLNGILSDLNIKSTYSFSQKYGQQTTLGTLFIPKSPHFTTKVFSLDYAKENFTLDEVRNKVELPVEEIGRKQKLSAVAYFKYNRASSTKSFDEHLKSLTEGGINYVGGFVEELGSNRIAFSEFAGIGGMSFYTGPGAQIKAYGIDFNLENSNDILEKMETQALGVMGGLCIVISHDSRPYSEQVDLQGESSDEDWSYATPPVPLISDNLKRLKEAIPDIPIVGVDSFFPVDLQCDPENTNVTPSSEMNFTYGFMLLTYKPSTTVYL